MPLNLKIIFESQEGEKCQNLKAPNTLPKSSKGTP